MPGSLPQAPALDLKIRVIEAGAEAYLIQAECTLPPLQASEPLPCAWVDQRLRPIAAQLAQSEPFDRPALTALGGLTFEALLRGSVRDLYRTLQARLEQQQRLRVLLELQPRRLREIPWELMYDPWLNDFTGGRDRTTLIRYAPPPPTAQAAVSRQGISILVVIARPIDLPPVNVAQQSEEALIRAALAAEEQAGRARVTVVGGKLSAIQAGLSGHPDVLHFIGHGQVNEQGIPGLMLETEAGLAEFASPDDLRRDFLDAAVRDRLRLLVLNACQTAQTPSTVGYDSLAHELLPLVGNIVAMQYPVSDDSAAAFASNLYRALGSALPLDEAITAARQAIRTREPLNPRDGLAPVLVTHGQDFLIEREWQPFKGPHPYTPADAPWFFERQASVQTLHRLLAFHPVILLVGPSHCGKTSLIQAGLIPNAGSRLIVDPVAVEADLEARLRAAIEARLRLEAQPPLPAGRLENQLDSLPANLTLCLDRVEQALTLGEAVQALLRALARWAAASLDKGDGRRLILIVQSETGSAEFAANGVRSVRNELHELRELILPAIDAYPMWLEPLDRDAVFRAIDQLTRNTGARFSPDAVTHILRALDYEQAPDMLKVQIVCRALHRKAREADCPEITPELLTETGLGSIEGILQRDFELDAALQRALEAHPEAARILLAQFVRADRLHARPVPEATLLQRSGLPAADTLQWLSQLVNDGLLRIEPGQSEPDQSRIYELVHAALVSKLAAWVNEDQLALRQSEEIIEKSGSGLLQLHSPDGGLDDLRPLRSRIAAWLTPAQQNRVLASALEANYAAETEAAAETLAWLAALPQPETVLPTLISPYLSAQGRLRSARLLAKLAENRAAAAPALDQLLSLALDDTPEVRQVASLALAPLATPSDLRARLTGLGGVNTLRAEESLARIYQSTGKLPAGSSLALRASLALRSVRLQAVSLALNTLLSGVLGGIGFAVLAMFNWYRNEIAGSETSMLSWLSLIPIGLLAFFLSFPGSSLVALGRDLAILLFGGQRARHAAWGAVLGSGLGMMISLFLFAIVRQAGGQTPALYSAPAAAGIITGTLIGLGWLPALAARRTDASVKPGPFKNAWPWVGAVGAAVLGAVAVFALAVELDWWPYSGYYLLSPATLGDARMIGGIPGLAIGIGLSLTVQVFLPPKVR